MQEEVENRTLTLVVSGTKFTGRMFKAAISKYMAHRKEKKLQKQRSRDAPVIPHGKQAICRSMAAPAFAAFCPSTGGRTMWMASSRTSSITSSSPSTKAA